MARAIGGSKHGRGLTAGDSKEAPPRVRRDLPARMEQHGAWGLSMLLAAGVQHGPPPTVYADQYWPQAKSTAAGAREATRRTNAAPSNGRSQQRAARATIPAPCQSWEARMKVDVTAATAFGNGAAAIALIVALLEALQSSEKLSMQDVDQILGRAAAMLPPDPTVGREGLKTIKSIVA